MTTHTSHYRKQLGLTLVELMIAMTIGMVLIGGALFVYSSARAAYSTNESYALMQENARFALSVIEPDVQLAGYWGLHRDPTVIIGSAKELEGRGEVLSDITDDCADNWIVRFDQHIEGYNDVEPPLNDLACIQNNTIQPDSDVFAIRRVDSNAATVLTDGQYYMRSSEAPLSEVFLGNTEPTTLPDSSANFPLVANAYYVSPDSIASEGDYSLPALRRVQLVELNNGPAMLDTEITTGVEDMQIQYGVGPANTTGSRSGVSIYVSDLETLTPPNTTVRSMRIWLLMRSERESTDYIDDKEYRLGDKVIPAPNDNYRRTVVSKTIFFRNLH